MKKPAMRFIVVGTGAVGGVVGGRLAQHGHDVVFTARGEQLAALSKRGLQINSPGDTVTVRSAVVEAPAEIRWQAGDVALLTVKTQDAVRALEDLAAAAPADTPIVCMQNGVESERIALRWFPRVYGVCVMCPATYLTPGVVEPAWSPVTGILDIGRYPAGSDEVADAIAAAFTASTFISESRPDIMRWKYGKLIMSVANSIGALCGPTARAGALANMAREEALACYRAAGIAYTSPEEEAARRSLLPESRAGQGPRGGSSWQSLQRRTATIECSYLNGEIALLGRLHNVPTPVNTLLQRLAEQAARDKQLPEGITPEQILATLNRAQTRSEG